VGDQVKRTDKGTTSDGKPIDRSLTIPWDGVDHDTPQTGITMAMKRINTSTIEWTLKHEGTAVEWGSYSISPDGNTMTFTSKGVNPAGRKVDNTYIFDKQENRDLKC